MSTAFIGMGSNVGDRLGHLSRAIDAIEDLAETHVELISHAYESEPAYDESQPRFVNAVCEVETGLEPEALLDGLLAIEDVMGRVRISDKGPRVIDLDLLLYDEEEIASPELTVPHPGILERDFVVTPLLEIAPRITLPDGTHPRRSHVTMGEVVRDLGKIPAIDEDDNMPIGPTEWAVVAESEWAQDVVAGFDAELQFKRSVLEQEGIPFAYEPFEPGVDMDPFGFQTTFRLVVPLEYASQARTVLDAVDEAQPLASIPDEASL